MPDFTLPQRIFWCLWTLAKDTANCVVPPLLLAFLDIYVGIVWLSADYRWNGDSVFLLSSAGCLVPFPVYSMLLIFFVVMEFVQVRDRGAHACSQCFNAKGGHIFAFGLTMLFLGLFTILAIIDARKE